jgi:hypothetical protein
MLNKDKLYLVLDEKGTDVEYTIHVPADEDIYILKRSNSETWSDHVKEEVILTILNSGDGFKIKWEEKPGKVLDYSQTIELTIMLNFINSVSRMPNRYSIVDSDDVVDLV